MGSKPSTSTAASSSPTITINRSPTTKAITPVTLSTAITTNTAPTTTTSIPSTKTTNAAPTTTSIPSTKTTNTVTTIPTTTTTTTTTTPTPPIISTASATKDTSTTPVSTEGTAKPTFYSVVKSATADADKTKSASAYARWYKWSKFEQQKRDKGKILWYMGPPVTTTDAPSTTTTTLTMTTAKIGDNQKEASDTSNVTAIPSFQLRSTAVYSPPHGDRVLSGRSELINTDLSIFKYYRPESRINPMGGIHTKATMYTMSTRPKQTLLPIQSSTLTTKNSNVSSNVTGDNPLLPAFVSRGLQTNLEPQPMNSSSTPARYYEKQQPQIVPVSAFSNNNSGNNGFFHLASKDTNSEPVLPPIEKTPVWLNDRAHSPVTTSILKKSSTVLSQEKSNPLLEQTHGRVLEELRKHNKDTTDGTYRAKKIHLLEKNHPSAVSFNLPPPPPPTKASQSILRSEKLFSSQLFNRKK